MLNMKRGFVEQCVMETERRLDSNKPCRQTYLEMDKVAFSPSDIWSTPSSQPG
jgi:hypothetical protein